MAKDPYAMKTFGGESKFLRLKSKGDSAKIRLASEPYIERNVWDERTNEFVDREKVAKFTAESWAHVVREPHYKVAETFYWLVIDRQTGTAKIFQASAAIYNMIGVYATDPDWGDPTGYDITVTRTEKPGTAYWDVRPSPDKSEITDEEQAMIDAMDISDLQKRAVLASEADSLEDLIAGKQPAKDLPDAPKPKPTKKAKAEDTVIEDVGDEPINLDDIPF